MNGEMQFAADDDGEDAGQPGERGRLAGLQVWLDPLVRERRVLELWPTQPEGDLPLAAGLAREWSVLAPEVPSLPFPPGEIDLVLALAAPWSARDGELQTGWLAEIDRVGALDGVLVLALGQPSPDRDQLLDQLRLRYPVVTIIGETSFLGVSFLLDGSDEMAIAGDLAGLAAGVRRQLVVCGRQVEAAALPRESVLVPVADPGYVVRLRQLTAENDELRERLLVLEEQREEQDRTLHVLRREAERHLDWVTGSETAAELAAVDRDQALARARTAERALADAEAALRRRSMEVAALTRETALASARETARETAPETAPSEPVPNPRTHP
jgi:hypothetical protein